MDKNDTLRSVWTYENNERAENQTGGIFGDFLELYLAPEALRPDAAAFSVTGFMRSCFARYDKYYSDCAAHRNNTINNAEEKYQSGKAELDAVKNAALTEIQKEYAGIFEEEENRFAREKHSQKLLINEAKEKARKWQRDEAVSINGQIAEIVRDIKNVPPTEDTPHNRKWHKKSLEAYQRFLREKNEEKAVLEKRLADNSASLEGARGKLSEIDQRGERKLREIKAKHDAENARIQSEKENKENEREDEYKKGTARLSYDLQREKTVAENAFLSQISALDDAIGAAFQNYTEDSALTEALRTSQNLRFSFEPDSYRIPKKLPLWFDCGSLTYTLPEKTLRKMSEAAQNTIIECAEHVSMSGNGRGRSFLSSKKVLTDFIPIFMALLLKMTGTVCIMRFSPQ